ncbi:MAG: T9SS type A sorting domain-containing protein [Candidatus Kapaibacterium sp.]
MTKKILITLILLISAAVLKAQQSGYVKSLHPVTEDSVINFGPCHYEDSISAVFELANTGSGVLRVIETDPSFFLGVSPNDDTGIEFEEFGHELSFPLQLSSQTKKIIYINFNPDDNFDVRPLGTKEAQLRISLLEESSNDVVAGKSYLLKAKKTAKYLDGYNDVLSFDSVYVYPVAAARRDWKVRSTYKDGIGIESQKLKMDSPVIWPEEITVSEYPNKPVLPDKYDELSWAVNYFPKDTLADRAEFSIYFKPDPANKPDSLDTASVIIEGRGVLQAAEFVNANHVTNGDTVNAGKVSTSGFVDISADLLNTGNIPIGAVSETLYIEGSIVNPADVIFEQKLSDESRHIPPGSLRKFKFSVSPHKRGEFLYEYRINTDIQSRGIHGVPDTAAYFSLYVKGTGTEPDVDLSIQGDTIDFGRVVINRIDCDEMKDTVINIKNNGNEPLELVSVISEDKSLFIPDTNKVIINAGDSFDLGLTFKPKSIEQYFKKLRLISERNNKRDTIAFILTGWGIGIRESKLRIPSVKSMPGRIISIPLLTDEAVVIANSFEGELRYDKSLLEFYDYITQGTASEPTTLAEINSLPGEEGIALKINLPPATRFYERDTLIILQFRTYLGEKISTSISISNHRFSDVNCYNVLKLDNTTENGEFRLDSVAGLRHKAYPRSSGLPELKLYPNPAQSEVLIDASGLRGSALIRMYDQYGNLAAEINSESADAELNEKINLNGFVPGMYTIVCSSGGAVTTRSLVIIR